MLESGRGSSVFREIEIAFEFTRVTEPLVRDWLPRCLAASLSHCFTVALPGRLSASSSLCLVVSLPRRLAVSLAQCLSISKTVCRNRQASRLLIAIDIERKRCIGTLAINCPFGVIFFDGFEHARRDARLSQ